MRVLVELPLGDGGDPVPLVGDDVDQSFLGEVEQRLADGVAETPKRAASAGAECTSLGRSSPAISAARKASATRSR
ncbi:hypothetical protein ACFQV4_21600 [Streptomyces thermocarboxydus]